MKIGAQLYSVRTLTQTEDAFDQTMKSLKEMGYAHVHLSKVGSISVSKIAEISKKYDLPILATHYPYERIIGDTDAVIAEHKEMGCRYCGLCCPAVEHRESLAGWQKLIDELEEPVKKMEAAGIHFAYHNHWFEFEKMPDGEKNGFDLFLEKCPNWTFIFDYAWIPQTGCNYIEYLKKAAPRIAQMHYRDYTMENGKMKICHCGAGSVDFKAITNLCNEYGIEDLFVEHDNAIDAENPLDEMKLSYDYLKTIV